MRFSIIKAFIFFPGFYKKYFAVAGSISGLKGISEIKHIQINDTISIAYRTIGTGPLIILCNGSLANMHFWDPDLVYHLSQQHEVMLFDYPGVCQSTLNDNTFEFNATNLAGIVHAMIQKLNLHPVTILGYSMGGFIVQALIEKYPNITEKIILIGTDFGGQNRISCDPAIKDEFATIAFMDNSIEKGLRMMHILFPQKIIPKMQIKMARIFLGAKKEGLLSNEVLEKEKHLLLSWMNENQHEENLKNVSLPILIFAGREDVLIPFGNAILLQKTFKNARLEEYTNAGHGLIFQYPIDIAEKIIAFL